MKKIEKMRTGEHPSAIPLLTRRVFRITALITALAVMPALVFTGCKQNKEVNIEWYDDGPPDAPPDEGMYYRFSGSREHMNRSAIDAITNARSKDSIYISLMGYTTEKVTFNDDASDLDIHGLILRHDVDRSITSPKEVIIDGNGAMITLTGGNTKNVPLITVGKGVTLTLQSITFKGMDGNTAPLIKVEEGGTLIMADHNTKIIGNNYNGNGGGVYVDDGVLEMRDGEISGNTAQNGGGVYMEGANSNFKMYGGKVRNNTAQQRGGGVYVNDGRIETVMADIRENIAKDRGGGVYVDAGGTFETMIGTAIDSNEATSAGGGVYVRGEFQMGISDVRGNNVTNKDGKGGGVYVENGGRFIMEAGSISGNSIYKNDITRPFPQYNPASGGKGPGVYVMTGGKLESYGGVIHGVIKNTQEDDDPAWEYADIQNYYMHRVYNPNTSADPEYVVESINADDIPWGSAQIGYAVYKEVYDGNYEVENKTVTGGD